MPAAKILVVEDEFIIAESVEMILKQAGYEVIGPVPSGEAAIFAAEDMQPNLILMDIKLKGVVDGISATQRIQLSFDIPVVYLTAHSDPDTLKRVIFSHPYGYLTKPFTPDGLREAVLKALTRHQAQKGQQSGEPSAPDQPPPS